MKTSSSNSSQTSMVIAITATFTADSLNAPLRFWFDELGLSARVEFAPYNQVFQQLLDQNSMLSGNSDGVNIVLVRLEDWMGAVDGETRSLEKTVARQEIERNVKCLHAALRACRERSSASFLLCLCPASPSLTSDPEWGGFFRKSEADIVAAVADMPGVYVVTPDELASYYRVPDFHDRHANELAHIPYTSVFFTALGTIIARRIYRLQSPPRKVIVLDCDHTLWSGVCGEDGPSGVKIDLPRQALQDFMVRQYEAGMLLCLCSKNNEVDVAEVFNCHQDMALKRDHFVSWRINWKPKSVNLASLAAELNLGLDSFIFVDDDPVECAEVESRCPEVLVFQLPRDPEKIPDFLKHLWVFDHLNITAESRQRTAFYQQNLAREALLGSSVSFEEFLRDLRLTVDFAELEKRDAARVSDLTLRTNQFNTTGIRHSEGELQRLRRSGEMEGFVVRVKDRFGDYGLVGVILFRIVEKTLVADLFLLSCRAMGRGVEHRMLAKLGELAAERGLGLVEIPVRVTPKNRPAVEFLERIEQGDKQTSAAGFVYRFAAKVASGVRFISRTEEKMESELSQETALKEAETTSGRDARPMANLLVSIALELQDPRKIHKIVLEQNRSRNDSPSDNEPPVTPMEKKVAAIWSEILGFHQVGRNDNFFNLGGHSLLAMQVLSRLHDTFAVELSPRILYTGEFTVAGLTKALLSEQVRGSSPATVAAVLQSLDSLTDDEARNLLNASKDPTGDLKQGG